MDLMRANAPQRFVGPFLFGLCVLLGSPSCSSGTAPRNVGPLVAVTGLEGGRVAVIDVAARRDVGRRGPMLQPQSYSGISAESTTVYYAGYNAAKALAVSALNVRSNTVRWTRTVRAGEYELPTGARVRIPGLPSFVTPAADTSELLWYPVNHDRAIGVARYRPSTDAMVGFLPIHLAAIHMNVLRGRGALPKGTLVVCATRQQTAQPRANALFFISPDLTVIDSIPLPPVGYEAYDVVVTSDERSAYVIAPPYLFRIDLATRRVLAQVSSFAAGTLALSHSGELLIVTDPGFGLNAPSSGKIALYSLELESRGTVDLRSLSPGGSPPTTWDAVTSIDGTLAYVLAGTTNITLGQSPQRASVFVVDLVRHAVTGRIPLDEFGVGRIFLLR